MKEASKKLRKAFTIVELVIVIAVIAILAAVLIPTFVNVTKKAKESSDIAVCKNLNDALAIAEVEETPEDFSDVLRILKERGYVVSSMNPSVSGCWFVWDSESNQILYLDENFTVLYNSKSYTTTYKDWYFAVSSLDAANALKAKNINVYYIATNTSEINGALNNGHAVNLSDNLVINSLTVENVDDAVINLNGYTLYLSNNMTASSNVTISNGTLAIDNASGDSTEIIYTVNSGDDTIYTLTLQDVTVQSDMTMNLSNAVLKIEGGNYSGNIGVNAATTIDGGTFTGEVNLKYSNDDPNYNTNDSLDGFSDEGVVNIVRNATFKGDLTIAGGIIESGSFNNVETTAYTLIKNGDFSGTLTVKNRTKITDGTFETAVFKANGFIYGGMFNKAVEFTIEAVANIYAGTAVFKDTLTLKAKAIINGGTFEEIYWTSASPLTINGGTFNGAITAEGSGKLTISGGTFNSTVSIKGIDQSKLQIDLTYTTSTTEDGYTVYTFTA